MRATLVQIDVDPAETPAERRGRAAALVRAQAGADLVVLPELWPVGAFASDEFAAEAEPAESGPTAGVMVAAARDAGVWLHAGSVVERDPEGPLYNTSLLFAPDGELAAVYRKIHRFGFDRGEAALMAGGERIVTARLPWGTAGLATCYDLRFPEQFRLLVDAGAELLVLCAGWPARRLEHWRVLVQARAIESQAYVLACGTAGTHAGVEQAGHSMVVDPWGTVLAEAGAGEEVLACELDPARVAATRAEFPVLRDRVLPL
ncbi:MAG: carbon-nitrogen family hydrolase [Streptomyces sp.]|nr:carbon-nitrogen family hydrolase [Streptomyces sp.]